MDTPALPHFGRRFAPFTVAFVLMSVLAGCGGSDDAGSASDELLIGFAVSKTGAVAPYDQPVLKGLEVAIETVNEAGGIDGKYMVRLVSRDTRSEAATAATVAQELVDDDGVDVLITGSDPEQAISAGQIAQRQGVPVLAGAVSTPTVPGAIGDASFLTTAIDNAQAAAQAQYARDQGYETAYLLKSPDTAYTQKLPEYFQTAFEAAGGKVIGEDSFSIGSGDLSTQVTKIKNLAPQPDVIETAAFVPEAPTFIRQLRAAGLDIPVIGADGFDTPALIDSAGRAADGVVFTTHGYPTEGSPTARFYDEYEARRGTTPESIFAAVGADQLDVISAAVAGAESTDPSAILDSMHGLTAKATTATITFPEDSGLPERDVAIVRVTNGEFEFVDQLTPENPPAP